MSEIWRDVVGYEGLYSVSSLGRVKSLERKVIYKNGYVHIHPEKIRKYTITNAGYQMVALSKESKKTWFSVHRLVATAFMHNINNCPQVNHIDGNKTNNALNNLEWVTQRDNQLHAINNKLYRTAKGDVKKSSKLKPDDVIKIRQLLKNGFTQRAIANKYNIHQVTVCDIKRGISWGWV